MSDRVINLWRWSAVFVCAAMFAVPTRADAQGTGTIRGRVTERDGTAPVPAALVSVVGTRLGAYARNEGDYILRGVPAGQQTIRVVRIGFQPLTRAVTVTADGEITADFTLDRAATKLAEVVTTATGEQERRQIGNVVSTVRADSLAAYRPITDVPTLLAGRTPSLNVIMGAGVVGSGPVLRIRGVNSLSLRNDPLVIVDGIRFETGSGASSLTTFGTTQLSVLNPQEIESIDVIKGPSAAALYGTAAANGVLVIKTRRGHAGRATWRAFGEYGTVQQPADFPDNFRSWGRLVSPTTGQPTGGALQCLIANAAAGTCQVDSLTTFNPLMNPETTPYADQPKYLYGLQVSGGSGPFNYFLSGQVDEERGPFEMPRSEITRLTTARGASPLEEQIHPNALKMKSVRANFGTDLGAKASVAVNAGFIDRNLRTPFDNGYFQGITWQTLQAPGYRGNYNGNILQYTGDIFSVTTEQQDRRMTGSMNAFYSPTSWLSLRAVGGIDQVSGFANTLQRFGEGVVTGWGNLIAQNGGKQGRREVNSRYSADLGGTATWNYRPSLHFKTSGGAQYFFDANYATIGDGFDLLPGATTWSAAGRRTTTEATVENATYGAYFEEAAAWRERLFLTGGVRTDKNSAFGLSQGSVLYPRASLSYVISDESFFPKIPLLQSLRLRSAWGKAGVQPTTTAALQYLSSSLVPIAGAETPALQLQAIGNAALKPEVTSETEFGADLSLLRGRLNLEVTHFNKESKDALVSVSLPPSPAAGFSRFSNLGKVKNAGWELTVDVEPYRSALAAWSVRLTGSTVNNEVVSLGNVPVSPNQGARNVPGYPISGLWARPILGFNDANGDGVLVENELTIGDSLVYRGPALPTKEATLSSTLSLWHDRIQLTAQMDYKGGHYSQWLMENNRCVGSLNCAAVNDPNSPLESQARAVAANSARYGRSLWGYLQKKDYARIREIALTVAATDRIKSMLRTRDASVTLSARNPWMVWTNYPGLDPENNYTFPSSGSVFDYDWFTPPLLRYWMVRFNLGL